MLRNKRHSSKQSDGDADGDPGHNEVRGAFHAVDMATTPSRTRRGSRSSSHGAVRAESWMARVSTAMSHRIFSAGGGNRRLSGSRSTQVMPMEPARRGGAANSASVGEDGVRLAASSSENSFLASAGSKPAASTASTAVATQVMGFEDVESEDDACPSVACDVESSDEDKASDRQRQPHRRTAKRTEWASKVAPNRSAPAFEDDDDGGEAATGPARGVAVHVGSLVSSPYVQRHLGGREAEGSDGDDAVATPAVLKDFFSRTPSVGVEIRDQQRRARREAHYRRVRERQDELRGRLEREDAQLGEASTASSDRRRLRAQQLRRRSVARRLELRREAATARDQVLTKMHEEDERSFRSAREHWERDFQDEICALGDAFRRARARNQNASGVLDAGDEESERPMTVAGLAVPEALSEIHRGLNNVDKRVKSAGDLPSPTRLEAVAQCGVLTRTRTPGTKVEASEALVVVTERRDEEEDEEGEDEEEQEEEEAIDGLLVAAGDMEGVAIDLPALIGERDRLLQRVADIDRLVEVQRRLGLLSDASSVGIKSDSIQ